MPAEHKHELLDPIDAISPLDGRYHDITEVLSPYASEAALIRTRTEVEALYLIALSDEGIIRPLENDERQALSTLGQSLSDKQVRDIKKIEATTKHDVKAVERGIWGFLQGSTMEDLTSYVHIALTSEDVNNLAYRLMAQRAKDQVCVPLLDGITDKLVAMAEESKDLVMIARTHGQPAVPTTLGKELINYAYRLNQQVRALAAFRLTGKLNGAVGNYNAHRFVFPNIDWEGFSTKFVEGLGLRPNLVTTQINAYEDFIEMFQSFMRINGIIIDFDQDTWRYISDAWFGQEVVKGEVGSSTMPHKVNPIKFENSEGNALLANGIFGAMAQALGQSRLDRDLRDSTIVRNVGSAFGYSILAYHNPLGGLSRVKPHKDNIHKALHENWVVLTEGVQVLLRTRGVQDPYSIISELTRGAVIDEQAWREWIEGLPAEIDDETRQLLAGMTPETYIGDAIELTDYAIEQIKASRN